MPLGYRKIQLSFAGGEVSPELFSRFDDTRFRSGAARVHNMISRPKGSVAKRPGFALVREVKDSAAGSVRLLPFRFSADQTYAVEMGRATVDAREIGYFRFHTDGGTLLQSKPDEYRDPQGASALNAGTDEFTVGTHGFETGDPIVLTLTATTETATFDTATNRITNTAHGFVNGDAVVFTNSGGALPPEVEANKVYYVINNNTNDFRIANSKSGGEGFIEFSSTGSGTHYVGALPAGLEANRTYYAIDRSATTIAVALSKGDAIAGTAVNIVTGQIGTVDRADVRIHYDYRPGSVVFSTTFGSPFYCFRTPWGTPGSRYVFTNDHLDHPVTSLNYWMRQPGSSATVTFDIALDRVNWTAHGLSNGDVVTFESTGTMPTEITTGTAYYVRNAETNSFQVAPSYPAPVTGLSGATSGTHTAFANGFYEVPHFFAADVLFEVNYAQSNDVLTLVHQDRPVTELRRLAATNWVLQDVEFNAGIEAPTGVEVAAFGGEGITVISVTTVPTILTTTEDHFLAEAETVMIQGVGSIPDGHYLVADAPSTKTFRIKEFETGEPVNSASTTVSSASVVRSSSYNPDWNETYAVTALLDGDLESEISDEFTIENNMDVNGASNTVTWMPVAEAARHRVYKKVNGLFGFIGEVDAPTTTFLDENIAPDLSITPPIADTSLRKTATVTFDITGDSVAWASHGLPAGTPVVFLSDGTLPTGIDYGVTYYVLNPSDDDFQISTTFGSETAVNITGSPSGVHSAVAGNFPAAVTYFEQRRVFGGSRVFPQDFWMTASGTESDLSYGIPIKDSDRISNRAASRERSQIRHAVPVGHLLFMSSASEYRVTSLDSDVLTPGSVSVRAPTHIGVSSVAPVLVNNNVLFASARGGQVHETGFLDQVGDFVTNDVSIRASHLFEDRTIVQMAYQQAPHSIVWAVSSAGTLLGLTYIPQEQVSGWHEHSTTGGLFESCVSVSEGDEDRLYVVVNRGGTRFVERMGTQGADTAIADAFYVDRGVVYSGSSPTITVSVPHLANETVHFLADGTAGTGLVSASGILTLTVTASKVAVGIPYSSELQTLPFGMQVDEAVGTGRTKNVSTAWVRVRNSGTFEVGPSLTDLSESHVPAAGSLATGLAQVVTLGQWDMEGQVFIRNQTQLPLHVVGLTLEVASGG